MDQMQLQLDGESLRSYASRCFPSLDVDKLSNDEVEMLIIGYNSKRKERFINVFMGMPIETFEKVMKTKVQNRHVGKKMARGYF